MSEETTAIFLPESQPDLPSDRFLDRELSWLDFNRRVLELAEDESIPVLERLRFLAIASSNLDEFFMVRVATLMSKIENNVTAQNVAGHRPLELLSFHSEENL